MQKSSGKVVRHTIITSRKEEGMNKMRQLSKGICIIFLCFYLYLHIELKKYNSCIGMYYISSTLWLYWLLRGSAHLKFLRNIFVYENELNETLKMVYYSYTAKCLV